MKAKVHIEELRWWEEVIGDIISCAERTGTGNIAHNLPCILYNLRHLRKSINVKLGKVECPDCKRTDFTINKVSAVCRVCHHQFSLMQ